MRLNIPETAPEEAQRLLPEGQYEFEVANITSKVSRSGKDMLMIMLKPTDPEFALYENVFDFITLPVEIDDSAPEQERYEIGRMNRLSRQNLEALWTSAGVDYDEANLDTQDVIGRVVSAVITHREDDNGETRTNVQRYLTD